MSDAIKIGPVWDRAVFAPSSRAVKYRLRTVCRFEDVKQLRLVEFIAAFEEEQLLNAHPDVEKVRRGAELWVDTQDGRQLRLGSSESGGLLLAQASEAASLIGAPLATERRHIAPGQEPGRSGPKVPPAPSEARQAA